MPPDLIPSCPVCGLEYGPDVIGHVEASDSCMAGAKIKAFRDSGFVALQASHERGETEQIAKKHRKILGTQLGPVIRERPSRKYVWVPAWSRDYLIALANVRTVSPHGSIRHEYAWEGRWLALLTFQPNALAVAETIRASLMLPAGLTAGPSFDVQGHVELFRLLSETFGIEPPARRRVIFT